MRSSLFMIPLSFSVHRYSTSFTVPKSTKTNGTRLLACPTTEGGKYKNQNPEEPQERRAEAEERNGRWWYEVTPKLIILESFSNHFCKKKEKGIIWRHLWLEVDTTVHGRLGEGERVTLLLRVKRR